jgi:hypothetical protein
MLSNDKKIAAQKSHGPINTASADAGETHLLKTTSPAKMAANRSNAQKATGPKTPEGKDRSRWNAVTHGLLCKRLVIAAEDKVAFAHLLACLCEDMRPEGALEEILIEKIAMAYWRLHLAFGCEADFVKSGALFVMSRAEPVARYSNSIHRQLIQDMNQFERWQRQRSGEYVPPPVSIDVNVSGLEPDGHVDALHDVSEIPGTIVVAVSADADDLNPAICPETAAAPETKEPKELTVQDDGVRLAESGSSGGESHRKGG